MEIKSKIIESWKLISERNGRTIRQKIRSVVFMCSGFAILVLSVVMLDGVFGVRYYAIETGENIGEFAVKKSSQYLENSQQAFLTMFARERANLIDREFEDIKSGVEVLQRAVTRIINFHGDPSKYPLRYITEASPNDGGEEDYMAWVFYAPDFSDTSTVRNEIGRLANLQTMMLGIAENIGKGRSVTPYIASKNGFIIEVDNKLPEWAFPDKNSTRAQTFNFYERPWFSDAENIGKIFFTAPYNGGRGEMLAISCTAPYYQNGEFYGVVGIGASLDRVSSLVLDTEIDDKGFCFVLDNDGHVVLSQKKEGILSFISLREQPNLLLNDNKDIAEMANEMLKNDTGICKINLDNKVYKVSFAKISTTGWSFAIVVEDTVINQILEENRAFISQETDAQVHSIGERIFQTTLLMIAAILAIIVFVGYSGQRLSKKITEPIEELTDGVREIASGNLDKKIAVKTGDEIEHLATCFNAMTDELQTYMKNLTKVVAEREKITTELNVATNIQQSMLPHDFNFGRNDFEIYATMNAAKMVGGDFYDFYLLDENHLVITVADVSGKGVPAALFMAMSEIILHIHSTMMKNPDDLSAAVKLTNELLVKNNDEMMFVTVFTGTLDLKTGKFIFVNGGHNPPMWYRKSKNKFEYLKLEENCVVGMMDELDFVQQEIQLEKGDILYLYTDGVTEAMDEQNNQYSEERLANCLNGIDAQESLEKILAAVRKDLTKHVGNAEQSDDITMLAVRWYK